MKKEFVIAGSQAMKFRFPDFPREPKDTDVICPWKKFHDAATLDDGRIEYIKKNTHSAIIKYKEFGTPIEYLFSDGSKSLELILDQLCDETDYLPVQVQYSLKKAHIHFPIKFQKHISDLMFLRSKLREIRGVSLDRDLNSETDLLEEFPALTQLHFEETEKRIGKLKTPKMNQTTEEFFGKSKKYVKSYFVHDDMHKALAHDGDPTYLRILKTGSEVETDITLWTTLTIQQRIWCVLEEVYVIALERKILPELFEVSALYENELGKEPWTAKEAFDWALMRVCTTLCDGFFRDFAVKAYDEIQKQYNPNYVELFFKNIIHYDNRNQDEKETS